MDLNEYQILTQATLLEKNGPSLLNAGLGLSGESGEVADLIKKHLFHNKWVTKEELLLEIGDVLYYVALAASSLNTTLADVAEMNIRKLWKRYPEKAQAYLDTLSETDAVNKSVYLEQ